MLEEANREHKYLAETGPTLRRAGPAHRSSLLTACLSAVVAVTEAGYNGPQVTKITACPSPWPKR